MSRGPQESPGREHILATAIREFAEQGFAGATTASIARRAGVTQPLVHHHFGSKQGLWNAVLSDLFGDLERTLDVTVKRVEGADRTTRLQELLRSLIRFTGRRPELSRLLRVEGGGGGASFRRLYDDWFSGMVELFRRELEAASRDGVIREVEPSMAYALIIGACTHVFSVPETMRCGFSLNTREQSVVEAYADFAADFILRGLAADRAPKRR